MRHSLLSALVAASVIVPAAHAGIVITEVMSSSGTGGTAGGPHRMTTHSASHARSES